MLHEFPPVALFHDFVGNKAIDAIKKEAEQYGYARSLYVSSGRSEGQHGDFRTSMNSWVLDTEENPSTPTIRKLNKRIEKLTGLETLKEGASETQVSSYMPMGYCDIHLDSVNPMFLINNSYNFQIDYADVLLYLLL